MTNGVKYDKGKTQWWYLPMSIMREVVDVLAYGDKKYPADDGCNWKRVPNAKKRYYSALIRHITAWWEGEANDPETGMHHLAHAITNLIFLLWFERNGYPDDKVDSELTNFNKAKAEWCEKKTPGRYWPQIPPTIDLGIRDR